jgi:hypothetical protein
MAYTLRPARTGRYFPLGKKFAGQSTDGHFMAWTNAYLTVDGKPIFGIAGEIHYSRLDPGRWADMLCKMKACGVNVVSTYIFWIHHEETQGRFDFSDRRDLRRFVTLCGELGLYVILRLGPFNHGEVRNGGVPDWVYGMPFEPRSTDPKFLRLVKKLYGKIAGQVQGLLYKDGGPVIAAQLDNEYMHSAALWEDTRGTTNEYVNSSGEGDAYLLALKRLCMETGLDVPFYTCTAWGGAVAPHQECVPLWGGYPYAPWLITPETPDHPATEEYLYRDSRSENCSRYHSYNPEYSPADMPFACCEMGGGMQTSYAYRFLVDPRSVDALANVKIGSGCNFVGYYMFCGGTNPTGKRNRYLHELWCPKLSYDYQAPVGEFGQLRESYRRLRLLHGTLNTFGSFLCEMETSLPGDEDALMPADTKTLRYAARRNGTMGFLFLNNFQDHAAMRDKTDIVFDLDIDLGKLRIPQEGSLNLAAGESCVLPFGLPVLGDTLAYATVQPVYILKTDSGEQWFCFQPEGMRGEMVFTGGGKITFGDGDVETKSVHLPGGDLRIFCFCRKAALGLQQVILQGKPHILWSDAAITQCDEGLMVEVDNEEAVLQLWPPERNASDISPDGACSLHQLFFSLPVLQVDVRCLSDTRHVLSVPKGSLDGIYDARLCIAYEGDAAQLFLSGEMVADHFHNGEVWEIGLRELAQQCLGRQLVLHIVPQKKDVHVLRDAMAAMTETVVEQHARLVSVSMKAVCRKKIVL